MVDAIDEAETTTNDAAAEQARLESVVDETLNLPKTEVKEVVDEKPAEQDAEQVAESEDEEVKEAEADKPDEETTDTVEQKPSDEELFVEVEDLNGKSYKITKIEDLPADFEPKNNRQIMEIIAQTNKLETQISERVATAAQAEQQAIIDGVRDGHMKAWDGEIKTLIDEKLLDKPKLASDNPKYAEDPAVAKVDAVYKYMNEVNTQRREAGNPNLLTSFRDTFELMEYRDMKVAQAEAKKTETDLAKTKAGVIGNNSTTNKDVPVYLAGSYRSIDDIPV